MGTFFFPPFFSFFFPLFFPFFFPPFLRTGKCIAPMPIPTPAPHTQSTTTAPYSGGIEFAFAIQSNMVFLTGASTLLECLAYLAFHLFSSPTVF